MPRSEYSEILSSSGQGMMQDMPKRKRKLGKCSNPDYVQAGFFVRKEVLYEVKRSLIGSDMDLSDLLDAFLTDYVKNRPIA